MPILFISSFAWAKTAAECEALNFAEADNVTRYECANVLHEDYSKQLNALVLEIKNEISDKKLKTVFTKSQNSFNSYKNDQCSYFAESYKMGTSTIGPILQEYCEAKLTKQRLDYLKSTFN